MIWIIVQCYQGRGIKFHSPSFNSSFLWIRVHQSNGAGSLPKSRPLSYHWYPATSPLCACCVCCVCPSMTTVIISSTMLLILHIHFLTFSLSLLPSLPPSFPPSLNVWDCWEMLTIVACCTALQCISSQELSSGSLPNSSTGGGRLKLKFSTFLIFWSFLN